MEGTFLSASVILITRRQNLDVDSIRPSIDGAEQAITSILDLVRKCRGSKVGLRTTAASS